MKLSLACGATVSVEKMIDSDERVSDIPRRVVNSFATALQNSQSLQERNHMKRTSLFVCAAAIGLVCVNVASAQGSLGTPASASLTAWILSVLGFFDSSGPVPDDDGVVNSKD